MDGKKIIKLSDGQIMTFSYPENYQILIEEELEFKSFINYGIKSERLGLNIFQKKSNEIIKIIASDYDILILKVKALINKLYEKWKNEELKKTHIALGNILTNSIYQQSTFVFNKLKRNDEFPIQKTEKPQYPELENVSSSPKKDDIKYQPRFNVAEKFLQARRLEKINKAAQLFISDCDKWQIEKEVIDKSNNDKIEEYESFIIIWNEEVKKWEQKKEAFDNENLDYNEYLAELSEKYLSKDVEGITSYSREVIRELNWADVIKDYLYSYYKLINSLLVIDFNLPHIDNIPKLKEIKFISVKNEFREVNYTDTQISLLYDYLIYQITLAVIYRIFSTDKIDAIDTVCFNGWVQFADKSTGADTRSCIVSLQASKTEFLELNLLKVDPKECFKKFRGIAASRLSSITPIRPIVQLDKTDKRIIESSEVLENVDVNFNLAEMAWEDFEHLIREIFEKEFSVNGGEVKVTQASRDGGVDAIAFDPDPIRGGKIIIQAKRYNNTVNVSAVRDLYGTVLNEGATKGILVTTSNYGPDSYEFAKNKPLALMNGANLLYLLEKHGRKARIDLRKK